MSICGRCAHRHPPSQLDCGSVCRYCKRKDREDGRVTAMADVRKVERKLGIKKRKPRMMKGSGRLFRLWLVTCAECESGPNTRWMQEDKRQAEISLRKDGWACKDGTWYCSKHK